MVGAALRFLQDPTVPWQRVISSNGAISDRGDGGEGAREQASRLRRGKSRNIMCDAQVVRIHANASPVSKTEGVEVTEAQGAGVGTGGRWRVSLSPAAGYGWCEFHFYFHVWCKIS